MSASDSTTRTPTTIRRLTGSGEREYGAFWERCAADPRTASLAVRFRGTGPSSVGQTPEVGCGYRRRWLRFLALRWIASNSSRLRPDPTATQVRGDSAR